MKKIVWISSYPKSGNTFLRAMLSAFFYSKEGIFKQDYLKNISEFPRDSAYQQGLEFFQNFFWYYGCQ